MNGGGAERLDWRGAVGAAWAVLVLALALRALAGAFFGG